MISFIIPAWKSNKFIEECLDSIQNQEAFKKHEVKYEILVGVDNCSETKEKLIQIKDKYKNLKIYWSAENKGPYIIKNSLVRKSSGDKLFFFDSDDILTNDAMSIITADGGNSEMVRFHFKNFKDGDRNTLNPSKRVAIGVFVISRSLFDKIGGFQNWLCEADADFFRRCKKNEIEFHEIKKELFHRRMHSTQLTSIYKLGKNKSKTREGYLQLSGEERYSWDIPLQAVETDLEEI